MTQQADVLLLCLCACVHVCVHVLKVIKRHQIKYCSVLVYVINRVSLYSWFCVLTLFLYCALPAHVRCKHFMHTLLYFTTLPDKERQRDQAGATYCLLLIDRDLLDLGLEVRHPGRVHHSQAGLGQSDGG